MTRACETGKAANLPLAVPTRSTCLLSRTVQRFKAAGLGNTMAMTHDRRIVNARGSQKRHGQDREDIRHSTPHLNLVHTQATLRLTSKRIPCLQRKMLRVLPVEHRPQAARRARRRRAWMALRRGEAGKPWQGILAAVPIAVIALTLDHREASHNNYENQQYPHGRCL